MTSFERIQHSRRLIGSALKHKPEDVIAEYSPHMNLGKMTTGYVHQRMVGEAASDDELLYLSESAILTSGVNDVDSIVRHVAGNYRDLDQGEMIAYIKQPGMVDVIAKHALLPEKVLLRTLQNNTHNHPLSRSIDINSVTDIPQLTARYDEIVRQSKHDSSAGCPLAVPKPDQKLELIFTNFSKWAGELSVRSLYASRK